MADMEYKNGALCLDKINISDRETYVIEDKEWSDVILDSSNKVIFGRKNNGETVIPILNSKSMDDELDKIYDYIDYIEESVIFSKPLDILILGDSYSKNGGAWAGYMIDMLPNGSSYNSLGVGSATLRDNNRDTSTYYYSDRPTSKITGNNKNTICCQITKLKRLMRGECRGIYVYFAVQSSVKNDGDLIINYQNGVIKTYHLTQGQSINDVHSMIMSDTVDGFTFKQYNHTNAIFIEADSPETNKMITVETSVVPIYLEKIEDAEHPIYQNSSPDVIIIQGGLNDNYDSDQIVETYISQFTKRVENVYVRPAYGTPSEATLGTCYIKTPIEEVNRTCFAGSYRYLCDELTTLFPWSQIFFAIVGGLGYWSADVVERRLKTAEQQRLCADYCSASVIDWHRDGQISVINNYPNGDGTQENPYTSGLGCHGHDTGDSMHPNGNGGKKYGRLAALTIKQKFLNIKH